jgi:RNA-directed DNA polymerase
MNEGGKSDSPVVPVKPPNNAASAAAEVVEGRGLAEGNTTSKRVPDTVPDQTRRVRWIVCVG